MILQTFSCDTVASGACSHASSCDSIATDATTQSCPFERRSLLEELAAKGVRLTSQRRVLVEIIQAAEQHLDAASLLELALQRDSNINRATVYRTLELLKRHRLIDELDLMHLKGEKHYYEAKTHREHVHLACFQCGGIEEVSIAMFERLKAEIAERTGFELKVTRLEIGGRCRKCQIQSQTQSETVK